LSATLLRLAANGHLPEAAHRLLEDGDPEPLLSWGATSGSGLLAGLGLYPAEAVTDAVQSLDLALPLDPPRLMHSELRALWRNRRSGCTLSMSSDGVVATDAK
jgi:hypothetical protein